MPGIIGGAVGHRMLRAVAGVPPRRDYCTGEAYRGKSKLEVLLGAAIWREFEGATVLDFGCGTGTEAVEIALHGARRVIGLDIRPAALAAARAHAAACGVADRCTFAETCDEPVDAVLSLDAFEHFAHPDAVLRAMAARLRPGGRIFIAFGPPWLHPLGGHLFSVFPWAHLLFTERAFMQWWAEFKTDGATRFSEVDGGLNGMTVGRFRALVRASGLEVEEFTPRPIRKTRMLAVGPAREFFTSTVRCRLRRPEH